LQKVENFEKVEMSLPHA
jgi:DNA-directed RNA polymerase subunit RPC12/RpoP